MNRFPESANTALVVLAVLAVMAALHLMKAILVPVALALLLACLLSPFTRFLRLVLPLSPTGAAIVLFIFLTVFGLILVYVAMQLPLTIYILESFFARIPADLFDAARIDGYSEWSIFWRISFPVALPAVATTIILNFILLWNEFLYAVVLITDEANRTLPLGIQRFMGDQLEDVGMIATGLMIAIVPVIILYAFFSERLIQGMTAGAVK